MALFTMYCPKCKSELRVTGISGVGTMYTCDVEGDACEKEWLIEEQKEDGYDRD